MRENAYIRMTPGERMEVARRAKAGDPAAIDLLLEGMRPIVLREAKGFTGRGVPYDDLVAAGMAAALHGLRDFDPGLNHQYVTYCVMKARYAFRRVVANERTLIRVPVHAQDKLAKWRKVVRGTPHFDSPPTDPETQRSLGFSDVDMQVVRAAARLRDAAVLGTGGADGFNPLAALPCPHADGTHTERVLETEAARERVAEVLSWLTPAERQLMREYHGVDGSSQLTLEECARKRGIAPKTFFTRLRKIRHKIRAITRAREGLGA